LRTLHRDGAVVPWNCGAANFFSEWVTPTGPKFSIAVRCRLGNREFEDLALLDTGAAHTMISEEVAQTMADDLESLELPPIRLSTGHGPRSGQFHKLSVTLLADPNDGEDLTIDGTVLVVTDWPESPIIGMRGLLELIRCAFDPGAHPSEAVYFFGYAGGQ
jgi:aspartyl protease